MGAPRRLRRRSVDPGVVAVTARLRRRIKVFPAGGDVCFFVGEVMLLFFLCGSGGLAGGSPGRFVSLSACGGGEFPVIPGGDCFFRVAAVVGDCGWFRSSILGPATADFGLLFRAGVFGVGAGFVPVYAAEDDGRCSPEGRCLCGFPTPCVFSSCVVWAFGLRFCVSDWRIREVEDERTP